MALSPAGLVASSTDSILLRADALACKSCYQLLLSLNPAAPHFIDKFRSDFCDLDWA